MMLQALRCGAMSSGRRRAPGRPEGAKTTRQRTARGAARRRHGIIAARGFSDVRTAELARELHCSVVDALQDRAEQGQPPSARPRSLGRTRPREVRGSRASGQDRLGAGAPVLPGHDGKPASPVALRSAGTSNASTRRTWHTRLISDRFVNRFVELLDDAVEAEEIKPTNTRFLALVFRSISRAIRDEQALRASGLTTEEAALLVDGLIWDGIRNRDSIGAVEGRDAMRP